jgi:hypothetical protein
VLFDVQKMKIRSKVILAAVLLAGIAIGSYLLIEPSADAWAAEKNLAKAETFRFGPQGIGAQISEDETRFFRIFESPKSHIVFRQLYDMGTPEAKAYAIVGLRQTFLGRNDSRIDDFERTITTFRAQGGCRRGECTPNELISAWTSEHFRFYVQNFR